MIQSPYTITLVPDGTATTLTLLAAGGWLDGWPTFDARQNIFESDGVTLQHAHFRPLGGVTLAIEFTVEDEHEDLLTALDAFLDAGMSGATDLMQISGTVTLTPSGVGTATVFGEAMVSVITPALPSGPVSTVTRAIRIQTTLPDS